VTPLRAEQHEREERNPSLWWASSAKGKDTLQRVCSLRRGGECGFQDVHHQEGNDGMALRHLTDWIEQQGGRIALPDIPDSLSVAGQKIVGTYNECIEDAEIEYSAKALEAFAQEMVEQGQLLLSLLKKRS